MRACLSGNRELALKLYNRDPKALAIINARGETCLNIAKSSGKADTIVEFPQHKCFNDTLSKLKYNQTIKTME